MELKPWETGAVVRVETINRVRYVEARHLQECVSEIARLKIEALAPSLEPEATVKDVNELIGMRAAELAKKRIDEAKRGLRFAYDRAELAESSAKAQIASLQKMYVEMLTGLHKEIAELKGSLAQMMAANLSRK